MKKFKAFAFASLVVLSFNFTINGNENDPCKKAFVKQKKSKENSELFADTSFLQTKYCNFYSDMKRSLAISFVRTDSLNYLEFASVYMGKDGFKRKFVLGPNVAIGFIFKDGTSQIIRFEGSEQLLTNLSNATTNRIILSKEMLDKLMSVPISKFEMQNPFGLLNQSKVIAEILSSKQSERVIKIAHCFHDRVAE